MAKRVYKNVYVHISNIDDLRNYLTTSQFEILISSLSKVYQDFQILKYDISDGTFSCIHSPDWDIANEPVVGKSIHYDSSGTMLSVRNGGTQVYHQKWQFVSNDYVGFNVNESKERTSFLERSLNLNQLRNRMGNKIFWDNLLRENNIPI